MISKILLTITHINKTIKHLNCLRPKENMYFYIMLLLTQYYFIMMYNNYFVYKSYSTKSD